MWGEGVEDHIYDDHGLTREEVEEAFENGDMDTFEKHAGSYRIEGRLSDGRTVRVRFGEEKGYIYPKTAHTV